jgi:DNA polymerase III alpha subunit
MSQHLSKTTLKDRTLWFDGDSTYPAKKISTALMDDIVPFADEIDDAIRQYNRNVLPEKQIRVKTENRSFNFDWIIPDEYKNLNIVDYVTDKLMTEHEQKKYPEDELADRANRVSHELILYKKHGVEDVLRVLIFVINTLTNQGVVWGVGRGSSVSSYVLYLIGVHDVDSVKYGLSITDFLH